MTQIDLPGLHPRRDIRVAAGRGGPVVWVRHLRVVRELNDSPEYVIRDVPLRRGLNVVWAPPGAPHAGTPAGAGLAGHTAGKTSFCRLLRYALGEPHFASEGTRRRVRERLPSAWLLAEVVVGGRTWAVARPLGLSKRPFCIPDGTVDQLAAASERVDLSVYLEAIAEATTAGLPATQFPDREGVIGWSHVLPWLARDQECRFADFVDWRHPLSASESPALTVEQRQFVIRAVLGLITDAERAELERNDALLGEKQEREREIPRLEYQARVDAQRLTALLDAGEATGLELFVSSARDRIAEHKADVAVRRARLVAEDPRAHATAERDQAIAAHARAEVVLDEVQQRLNAQREMAAQLDDRARGQAAQTLVAGLPPGRDFCNVPMREARRAGCPLATSRTVDIAELRDRRNFDEERAACSNNVAALEREHALRSAELHAADAARAEAHARYMRALTAYNDVRDVLSGEDARWNEAQRFVDHADDSQRWARAAAERAKRLSAEIDESYKRQDAARELSRAGLGHFSAVFDHVASALLGSDIRAKIDAAGRSLALRVDQHGDRDSAAVATVKLLAFDLAALTASIEGRGHFPRLLIHDGPREADLAPDVYERLFLYATQLEQLFEGEPGFQYILTTTTDPPASVAVEPWLRLQLSGASAETRLYGMDL